MAAVAYPPFRNDLFGPAPLGLSRSRSRRQSIVGYGGQQPIGFPYSDHAGMYTEPPMPVGLHDEVSDWYFSFLSLADISSLEGVPPTFISNILRATG